jgi:membrane-bound metal-dependent hydrolase YbcI (DUF457 family)
VLRAKLGARISLPFCLLGSYAPDMATKWLVYGVSLEGDRLRIGDPMQFHRGWPGVGSYSFGALVSMLIFAVAKNRVFALSFLIGQWLHTTSDMLDSVGVMALFPFSTMHVSTDTYQYAGELGRLNDAHAYYTGLGGICDLAFVILLIPYWRVLTQDYFTREVIDSDPAFTSIGVSPSCTRPRSGCSHPSEPPGLGGRTRSGSRCSARRRPMSVEYGSVAALSASRMPKARATRRKFSRLTVPRPVSRSRNVFRAMPARSATCAAVSPRRRRQMARSWPMFRRAERTGIGVGRADLWLARS